MTKCERDLLVAVAYALASHIQERRIDGEPHGQLAREPFRKFMDMIAAVQAEDEARRKAVPYEQLVNVLSGPA